MGNRADHSHDLGRSCARRDNTHAATDLLASGARGDSTHRADDTTDSGEDCSSEFWLDMQGNAPTPMAAEYLKTLERDALKLSVGR